MARTPFAEHAVEVQGLGKSYGATRVLRNLDLVVPWGQCQVLFGANGSGKTTIVKVLATLARPDTGVIRVAGFDRQRQPVAVRASVGVLGHQALLYQDLTPVENLRFYGRLYGVSALGRRVAWALRHFGLTAYGDQRVRTLSHGMQKRVSLARAILHDPPVLLLDEPEAGLDQEAVQMLQDTIRDYTTRAHAVLMITHNLEQGLSLAHRVGILAGGRLTYQGAKEAADLSTLRETFRRATGVAP